MEDLNQKANKDLETILNLIKKTITSEAGSIYDYDFINVFKAYISTYRSSGVTLLLDYLSKATSRILTCMDIVKAVALSNYINNEEKKMFMFNTVKKANWLKIQRSATYQLFLLRDVESLTSLLDSLVETDLTGLIKEYLLKLQ